MAILRGGRRIGGFDVRLGLPRDRSLDNVYGDARLRQKPGTNPETTIGRFQSMVNEGEGLARKARYYVEFVLPEKGLIQPRAGDNPNDVIGVSSLSEEEAGFSSSFDRHQFQKQQGRRVNAFCNSIQMPERSAVMKEIKHNGPRRKFVYDYTSAPITATFYTDKFLRERSYFEMWQRAAFSGQTHNYDFYDNYVSDVNIFQLGSFVSRQERDDVTYAVKLYDCFPKTIGAVSYAHADSNQLQTFEVTFEFRYWVNYFLDKAGGVKVGQPEYYAHKQEQRGGIFGGLLSKLPPEIRRAGREVINDIRRRVPIGGVTGGRVFPPFKIPPLNL